ncbi:hypothetical protein FQA39_LY03075 [Lamprigera yunnana]|nr:hypothetical protein FQA39_LY03075 [Lamprigera yunnana]
MEQDILQAIMLFLLVTLAFGMRVTFSVGIVAMTDPEGSPNPDVLTYEWDDESIILSSFGWDYVIPQDSWLRVLQDFNHLELFFFTGCSFSGFQVNHLDLSLMRSEMLMGIANGVSNVFSIIATLIIQFIVTDPILGNVVFIIFDSGEVRPWNVVECEDDDTVDGKSETSTRSVGRY